MATIPDIVRHDPPPPADYDRLIRLLDAEMLESVGHFAPAEETEIDQAEAPEFRSATQRFLPIASVGLAACVVSVLILAHFSGM